MLSQGGKILREGGEAMANGESKRALPGRWAGASCPVGQAGSGSSQNGFVCLRHMSSCYCWFEVSSDIHRCSNTSIRACCFSMIALVLLSQVAPMLSLLGGPGLGLFQFGDPAAKLENRAFPLFGQVLPVGVLL